MVLSSDKTQVTSSDPPVEEKEVVVETNDNDQEESAASEPVILDDPKNESQTETDQDSDEASDEDEVETSKEDSPQPEEGTLEAFFAEEEPITFKKKTKFQNLKDGDVVMNSAGRNTIKAKHVYDDLGAIFGSDTTDARLETFFSINKAKPTKADMIAKVAGFKSRHRMAAAIEEFREAKTQEEAQEILERDFPEWTYTKDVELPFDVDLMEDKKPFEKKDGAFSWTQPELKRAVNDFVADHGIPKEDILRNAEVMQRLQDFSGLSRNGKPLTASDALDMLMPLIKKKTKLSKDKKVSIGGGRGAVSQNRSKGAEKISPELSGLMASAGIDPKAFQEFEKNKRARK